MLATLHTWCIGLVLLVLVAGCYDITDESMYAYQFNEIRRIGELWSIGDLDYDGEDEIIYRVQQTSLTQYETWLFTTNTGQTIGRAMIPGRVLTPPTIVDFDSDAFEKEVLFGVNRSDSLFLYSFEPDATPAGPPLLIGTGKKRIESNGAIYPWEAEVRFLLNDADDDGTKELISILNSTNTGYPRGISVHDMASGEVLGSYWSGASILDPFFFADVDFDDKLEMGFASSVPNHGASANGYSDSEGHILIFELGLQPTVEWSITSELPLNEFLAFRGTFTEKNADELVIVSICQSSVIPSLSIIAVYDLTRPMARQIPSTAQVTEIVTSATLSDLDGDGVAELYLVTRNGELLVMDKGTLERPNLSLGKIKSVHAFTDLNGDHQPELAVVRTNGHTAVLTRHQNIVSIIPAAGLMAEEIRRGDGGRIIPSMDGTLYEAEYDSSYLIHRYLDEVLLLLTAALMASLLFIAYRRGRQRGSTEIHDSDSIAFHELTTSMIVSAHDTRKKALLILEQKFNDPTFDVSEWALETGFNTPRQLERVMKSFTGHTPEQLLWLRRIKEGDRLLRSNHSKLTVSEIAFRSGFKEQSHFSRKYRDEMGRPPSTVRPLSTAE